MVVAMTAISEIDLFAALSAEGDLVSFTPPCVVSGARLLLLCFGTSIVTAIEAPPSSPARRWYSSRAPASFSDICGPGCYCDECNVER